MLDRILSFIANTLSDTPQIVEKKVYNGTYVRIWGEKWSDGRMVINYYYHGLTKTSYTTWNNMHGFNQAIDWGSDIGWYFKDAYYSVNYAWGIGSGFAINAGEMQRSTGKTNIYALSSASGSQPVNISLKADGFWKNYSEPQTVYRWHRTA